MQVPFTLEQLLSNPELISAYKQVDRITITCSQCKSPFIKDIKAVRRTISNGYTKTFCSKACKHLDQHFSRSSEVTCFNCQKKFRKLNHDIIPGRNNYCSCACSCEYNRTHKTWCTKISKLEKYLQEKLVLKFPSIEFHFNRADAINSELDIYIPKLKLGIEINGIFHYEPIYGPELLSRIQNNDTRKFQACLERGIEFCSIDSSMVKRVRDSTAAPILKVIEDLIELKLHS